MVPHAPPLRIVVIEDHDSLRWLTVDFLASLGHEVIGVPDAETLDEELGRFAADLLIIDLHLPGEDGLSICRRLRETSPNIGLILLTAQSDAEHRSAGYASGADIYLTKPASDVELGSAVQNLARRLKPAVPDEQRISLIAAGLQLRGPLGTQSVTEQEVVLLRGLAQAHQRQLQTWQLLELLGIPVDEDGKSALEVRIVRLRKKLVGAGVPEPGIRAVRRVGYTLTFDLEVH